MPENMDVILRVAAASLFLLGGSGLFLAFLSLAERWRAYAKKRSLFEKSAAQIDTLCAVALLSFAAASDADLYFSGALNARLAQASGFVWLVFCLCASAAAFFAVLTAVVKKGARRPLSALTCVFSLPALALLIMLSWEFFFAPGHEGSVDSLSSSVDYFCGSVFPKAGFWLHAACAAAAMASSSCLLAACWHILCRARNDYGRDFYTAVLGLRSRQAAFSLFLMIVFVACAAAFRLSGSGMPEHFLAFATAGHANMICSAAALLVIAAALLCRIVGTHAVPMQKRSYVFMAAVCFYAGSFALGRMAEALPLF